MPPGLEKKQEPSLTHRPGLPRWAGSHIPSSFWPHSLSRCLQGPGSPPKETAAPRPQQAGRSGGQPQFLPALPQGPFHRPPHLPACWEPHPFLGKSLEPGAFPQNPGRRYKASVIAQSSRGVRSPMFWVEVQHTCLVRLHRAPPLLGAPGLENFPFLPECRTMTLTSMRTQQPC